MAKDDNIHEGSSSPEQRLRTFRAASSTNTLPTTEQAQSAAVALLQSFVLVQLCHRAALRYKAIESDDLLQEVRIALLSDQKFNAEAVGVLGYLQRKVGWVAIDLLRKQVKEKGVPTDPSVLRVISEMPSKYGVDSSVDYTLIEDLKKHFKLTPKEARVLALEIGGFGLNLREIAGLFDVSHASVRQLHARALQRIAATFGNAEEIKIYSQLQTSGDVAEAAQALDLRPQDVVDTVKKIQMRIDDLLQGWED